MTVKVETEEELLTLLAKVGQCNFCGQIIINHAETSLSDNQIIAVAIKARSLGLVAAVIADAGRTQIAAGSKTVI